MSESTREPVGDEVEPDTAAPVRRRLTRFRVFLLAALVVVAAAAWSAYTAYRAQQELRAADAAYDEVAVAFTADNRDQRDAALGELRERAAAVRDRTDGAWWGLMTKAPGGIGDDLRGVEELAAAYGVVADDGLKPLFRVTDAVRDLGLAHDGQVDLGLLTSFKDPLSRAQAAFAAADGHLDSDPTDFSASLRKPYDDHARQVAALDRALSTASTASRVVPRMLGADGPRDYLLVLQDNATIRPTGGVPVAWARVHAEAGRVTIQEQGGPDDFPPGTVELTADERELYGPRLGSDFADAGLTPDFPRAAEIMATHYADLHPETPLDGVVAVDQVTLAAVLQALGGVRVNGVDLRADNTVDVLAGDVHRLLAPSRQPAAYQTTVATVLGAVFAASGQSYDLLLAFAAAADQGRVLLAPIDEADAADLAGSAVLGGLSGDDGDTPHVDVTLADDTGGAMSYYLRHEATVRATGCDDGRQQLTGTLALRQELDQAEATRLPTTVTGGGRGVAPGSQALVVRLYAPYGGSVDAISVDGVEREVALFGGDDRPTAALRVVVSGQEPVEVTWRMTTGPGQSGRGEVGVTPGVEPVGADSTFASACG